MSQTSSWLLRSLSSQRKALSRSGFYFRNAATGSQRPTSSFSYRDPLNYIFPVSSAHHVNYSSGSFFSATKIIGVGGATQSGLIHNNYAASCTSKVGLKFYTSASDIEVDERDDLEEKSDETLLVDDTISNVHKTKLADTESLDFTSIGVEKLPTVIIVGRPNVGKSALFNRLIRRREALVYNTPEDHVTRDIREGVAKLGDLRFRVLDSAGLETAATSGSILDRTSEMTANVIARAHLALFLIDIRHGSWKMVA